MGRKANDKDIAEYLWHSKPQQLSKNGNYRIRYGYLDSNGVERQTTETLENAQKRDQFLRFLNMREAERKKKSRSAILISSQSQKIETVEDLLYAYAEHAKYLHAIGDKHGWDESTYKSRLGLIRNYLVPTMGGYQIWEITVSDIEDGFQKIFSMPQALGNHKPTKEKKLVTSRTVYDCKKTMSKAFSWARKSRKIIDYNPMREIEMSAPKSERRTPWTNEEFLTAINYCFDSGDLELAIYLWCAVELSIRESELLALTWDDVFDNKSTGEKQSYIRVYKELCKRSLDWIEETHYKGVLKVFDQLDSTNMETTTRTVFHTTKTDKEINSKSDRIYISDDLMSLLREYKDRQAKHKQEVYFVYRDENLLFAQANGYPIHTALILKRIHRLAAQCNIPKIDAYSLRHLSITKKLALNGHDYVSTAKDSGHKNMTTMIVYYETPEDKVRVDTVNSIGTEIADRLKKDSAATTAPNEDVLLKDVQQKLNNPIARKFIESTINSLNESGII